MKLSFYSPAVKIFNLMLLLATMTGLGMLASGQQAANTINTIAGGGATPTNPLSLDLPGPTAVMKDGSGNLYFTAPESAYVFELTTGGTLQNYSGLGWGYFAGDGGPVGSANVGQVTDVVMDSKGNIYFTDIGASRIREINTSGIINTVAGSGTKCDDVLGTQATACGDGGPALDADVNIPTSIAVDGAGNIYITDTVDNRIRVVNTGATTVTIAGTSICAGCIATIVGDGTSCPTTSNCGDGGPASAAEVNYPKGIFVDAAGDIFIADTDDQEIREIVAGQSNITSYAGQVHAACPQSTSGCNDGSLATAALLRLPQGIVLDANGNGYIADTGNNKLRYVNGPSSQNPGVINTMAGNGTQGFSGDGGLAQQAELDSPNGVYVDSSLNIYVADTGNQRVREFTLAGNISTIAGGSLGDGPALSAQFALPYFVVEDASGNLYFTDQANNRVRKLTNNGGTWTVSTVAGTGSAGFSGDTGLATAATLSAPSGLALDNLGHLYVNDTNNLVIRQITLSSGIINTVAGMAGQGCAPPTACGDGGAATAASFTSPLGIATDSHGNLFIADYLGYRVRAVNMGSSTATINNVSIGAGDIKTVVGIGSQGDCSAPGHTCNGTAIKTGINHPGGVAVDSNFNLYFADQWNDQVRIVSPAGIITNYALDGKPGPMGDGGPAASGAMWNPLLVTLDPYGNLYISGGNDDLVQRVDVSTTGPGGPHEIGTVIGQPTNPTIGGFGGDGNLATANNVRISNLGSSVDGSGNLYIADGGNNRIRYVPMAPAINSSVTSLNLGNSPIGTKSGGKSVTITSAGGAELVVSAIGVTGTDASQFAQTNTCGTAPVNMGEDAACIITVTMTPSQYGPISGTLTVTDNVATSPQAVTLTGSGPDYTVKASPTGITVAEGKQGTSTISLTPVAEFNQTVNLSVTGCPTAATCNLASGTETLNGSTASTDVLTVTVGSTTPVGTYTLVVNTTFQSLSNPVNVTLKVVK